MSSTSTFYIRIPCASYILILKLQAFLTCRRVSLNFRQNKHFLNIFWSGIFYVMLLYILWEFHRMCLDHIHSPFPRNFQFLPDPLLYHYLHKNPRSCCHPSWMCVCFINVGSVVCIGHLLLGPAMKYSQYTKCHTVERNWSLSPSQNQMPIAPQL